MWLARLPATTLRQIGKGTRYLRSSRLEPGVQVAQLPSESLSTGVQISTCTGLMDGVLPDRFQTVKSLKAV